MLKWFKRAPVILERYPVKVDLDYLVMAVELLTEEPARILAGFDQASLLGQVCIGEGEEARVYAISVAANTDGRMRFSLGGCTNAREETFPFVNGMKNWYVTYIDEERGELKVARANIGDKSPLWKTGELPVNYQ